MIAAAAARKRVSSVDGMEMRGTRSETGKRDRTAEMVSGGGRGSSECGDGRRGTQEEEPSGEARRGRYYTNGREEHWERRTRACTGSRRGRRAEPPLVPASSQTNGPSPDAEVALFAALVQVYIYGLIPLPVVTGRSAPLRSLARSFFRSLTRSYCRLVCRCTRRHRRVAGDYRGSRRTSRSPYLTRTMPCRA